MAVQATVHRQPNLSTLLEFLMAHGIDLFTSDKKVE